QLPKAFGPCVPLGELPKLPDQHHDPVHPPPVTVIEVFSVASGATPLVAVRVNGHCQVVEIA
ncbi:hypothetical protein R3Q06_36675, partial [Rhodococcus erythropolis]|uniref:hypothetical protein n=1 Tax=Rhodococcus erythropolis TaxID=1833 RepID=UPI002949EAA0